MPDLKVYDLQSSGTAKDLSCSCLPTTPQTKTTAKLEAGVDVKFLSNACKLLRKVFLTS